MPDLHALAKTYALSDSYSTGTQPPSGPNHWWLFSGQSASSSQQQSYPRTGTQFDRFLQRRHRPDERGHQRLHGHPTGTGSGSSPYTFIMNGDFYWMLNSGSGYWKNPADGKLEVLPPTARARTSRKSCTTTSTPATTRASPTARSRTTTSTS